MDIAFDVCVRLLQLASGLTGLSYKEINVLIFCVIWPLLTLVQSWITVRWWRQRKQLRKITEARSVPDEQGEQPDAAQQ